MGNAELLDTDALTEIDRSAQETIIAACEKGADLTRRMLSFARQSRLDPRRVLITDIIEGLLPLL